MLHCVRLGVVFLLFKTFSYFFNTFRVVRQSASQGKQENVGGGLNERYNKPQPRAHLSHVSGSFKELAVDLVSEGVHKRPFCSCID